MRVVPTERDSIEGINVTIDLSAEKQAVRIPDMIINFLDEGNVGAAGTRGADLTPHVHRISGWRVEADRETMACMIPNEFSRDLVESLEQNGWFTLTIEKIPSHETYQFKGEFLSAGPCTAADVEACDRVRDRFGRTIPTFMPYSERAARAYVIPPSVTVRFRVREIFAQTPGPGAGRRLVPAEAPQ